MVRFVRIFRLNSMPRTRLLSSGLVVSVSALRLYYTGGEFYVYLCYFYDKVHSSHGLQLGLCGFYPASLTKPSYLTVKLHMVNCLSLLHAPLCFRILALYKVSCIPLYVPSTAH